MLQRYVGVFLDGCDTFQLLFRKVPLIGGIDDK